MLLDDGDEVFGYCWKCGDKVRISVLNMNDGRCTICGGCLSGRLVKRKHIPEPSPSQENGVRILEG